MPFHQGFPATDNARARFRFGAGFIEIAGKPGGLGASSANWADALEFSCSIGELQAFVEERVCAATGPCPQQSQAVERNDARVCPQIGRSRSRTSSRSGAVRSPDSS